MNNLDLYLTELEKLTILQQQLVSIVNNLIRLKPTKVGGYTFPPVANSISEQIQNWPNTSPVFPIASWVEPDIGEFEMYDDTWKYNFGGQEICFGNVEKQTIVHAAYSSKGSICVTAWSMYRFLKSKIKNGQIRNPLLLEQNDDLFSHLVHIGQLKAIKGREKFLESVVYELIA